MVDGSPYDPDKSYKDSKLCNVLFTQEMQRKLSAKRSKVGRGMVVVVVVEVGVVVRVGEEKDVRVVAG